MIGSCNHLRNSESPVIIYSLKLSMELNEEGQTSCFTSVNKIGEVLSTTIDLLVNTKGLPNKRLNESIEQSRKLQLYISPKEHPGFENCLNLPNKKLCQAITKLRISGHKFPIKTGRFGYRKRTERIFPLCCDGIRDEIHMFPETALLCLKNQEAFEKESLKSHFCIIQKLVLLLLFLLFRMFIVYLFRI